jgi:hypothetical protein
MIGFKNFFILLFILIFPTTAFATAKANLDLWKHDYNYYGKCGHCAPLLSFPGNDSRADFSEYSWWSRSGYFTINLRGPKGTAVTLFGRENFATENGYLVIVKLDDQDIEITDLEGFAPEEWTTLNDETSGNYSAYYLPYQNFKSLIASFQWGKGPQSGTNK